MIVDIIEEKDREYTNFEIDHYFDQEHKSYGATIRQGLNTFPEMIIKDGLCGLYLWNELKEFYYEKKKKEEKD